MATFAVTAPTAALAEENTLKENTRNETTIPEQDLTLCFVCMRWTTDAPECRGTFHGCDLQPAVPKA